MNATHTPRERSPERDADVVQQNIGFIAGAKFVLDAIGVPGMAGRDSSNAPFVFQKWLRSCSANCAQGIVADLPDAADILKYVDLDLVAPVKRSTPRGGQPGGRKALTGTRAATMTCLRRISPNAPISIENLITETAATLPKGNSVRGLDRRAEYARAAIDRLCEEGYLFANQGAVSAHPSED